MGYGAMRITGPGIWGDPPDRDQAKAALRRALELDVNFIDTADSYGPEVSEILIAEALYPYHEDLVIATKGGLVRPAAEPLGPGWQAGAPARGIRGQPAEAEARADPALPVPRARSRGAAGRLHRRPGRNEGRGKIRHIGVSNFSAEQVQEAQQIVPVVSVQNRSTSRPFLRPVLDLCTQETLAFLPWAPIQETERIAAVLGAAKRLGVSERQIALAWLLAQSAQILPIPGSGGPARGRQHRRRQPRAHPGRVQLHHRRHRRGLTLPPPPPPPLR